MPGLVAALPLIFAGATAATTIGSTIYNLQDYKGPDTNQAALDKASSDAAALKDAQGLEQQKTALLRRSAPDVQSAIGGALSPDSFGQYSALLAGIPGDPLASKVFSSDGLTAPSTGTGTSGLTTDNGSSSTTPSIPQMASSGSYAPTSDGNGLMAMLAKIFTGGGGSPSGPGSLNLSGGDSSGMGMEDMFRQFAAA